MTRKTLRSEWRVAMRRGKRSALDKESPWGKLRDELERVKALIRAKVEHPFHILKRQFGHQKARYRGLMKNTQQLHTPFALSKAVDDAPSTTIGCQELIALGLEG